MAHLNVGDKVIVRFSEKEQTRGNPVRNLNGQQFEIERVREFVYGTSGAMRGTEYYLKGAVSPYGIPYAFIEEQLVKI